MSSATARSMLPAPVVAIVDLNADQPNQGVGALRDLIRAAGATPTVLRTRSRVELPRLDHSAWVLTGGPGSPTTPARWRTALISLLQAPNRPPVFGVCLGFQLLAAAHGWRLAPLPQPRFGTFSIRRTAEGQRDCLFAGLAPGARTLEQRRWGVFPAAGASGQPLAIGPDGDIVAARFGHDCAGAVFHPEASPNAVARWFKGDPAARDKLIARNGAPAWQQMCDTTQDLATVYETVLPGFLRRALVTGA